MWSLIFRWIALMCACSIHLSEKASPQSPQSSSLIFACTAFTCLVRLLRDGHLKEQSRQRNLSDSWSSIFIILKVSRSNSQCKELKINRIHQLISVICSALFYAIDLNQQKENDLWSKLFKRNTFVSHLFSMRNEHVHRISMHNHFRCWFLMWYLNPESLLKVLLHAWHAIIIFWCILMWYFNPGSLLKVFIHSWFHFGPLYPIPLYLIPLYHFPLFCYTTFLSL